MDHQQWHVDVDDLVDGIEFLRQQPAYRQPVHRQVVIGHFRHGITKRGEGGFDHQATDRHRAMILLRLRSQVCRKIDGHRTAQRMTVDQALAGIRLHHRETLPRRPRILVDTGFRRQIAFALAETPVVNRQYRIAHGA
ncbi:hypothetical protein D3C84_654080 [compost metagenome]